MSDTTNTLAEQLVENARAAIEANTMILYRRWEIEARAAVVAVLRVLAEVAPGTPEYAVEFDFDALAERVEQRQR